MEAALSLDEFHHILTEAMPLLHKHARRIVADEHLIEDLVQDTLARALELGPPLDYRDLSKWLYSVMCYCWRYNRFYRSSFEDHIIALNDTDENRHGIELQNSLLKLLPAQRTIILLAAKGMKYREIAEHENIPFGTVMSRLSRARADLKALLSGKAIIKDEALGCGRIQDKARSGTPNGIDIAAIAFSIAQFVGRSSGRRIDTERTLQRIPRIYRMQSERVVERIIRVCSVAKPPSKVDRVRLYQLVASELAKRPQQDDLNAFLFGLKLLHQRAAQVPKLEPPHGFARSEIPEWFKKLTGAYAS